MSAVLIAAVLAGAAVWVAMPDPGTQLRRLGDGSPIPAAVPARILRGRQGAPGVRIRLLLGLLAIGAVLAWDASLAGAIWAAVLGLAVFVGVGWVAPRDKVPEALRVDLADTVELLAVCLEAGRSMGEALNVVAAECGAATGAVLSRVTGQLALGVPEPQAWNELADHAVWGGVARDVARSARSGTAVVQMLHLHAEEARVAVHERALERARTAGVRSVVPLMACFLPAFVLVGVLPIIAGLLQGLLSP